MKKPFFEPIDFIINNDIVGLIYLGSKIHVDAACRIANAKLEKEIQSWVTVYGRFDARGAVGFCEYQRNESYMPATHTAKLAFIEEIPKKECAHEPIGRIGSKDKQWYQGSSTVSCGLIQPTSYECKKCGVELKATWSAK